MELKINASEDSHECVSTIFGNVVIYLCPQCKGWEMKQDILTGNITKNSIAKKSVIKHHGSFVGNTYDLQNPN